MLTMLNKYENQHTQIKTGYNYLKYNYQAHRRPPFFLCHQCHIWLQISIPNPVGGIQIKMSLPVIGILQSTPKLV